MGLRLSGSGGEPGRDWNGRIGNLLSWSRSSAVSFGPAPSKEPQAAAASSSSSPSSSNTLNSFLSEQNRCRQNELGNLGDELADVSFRVQEDQGEASLSKNEVSFKV